MDNLRCSTSEIEKGPEGRARAPRISSGDPELIQKLTSRVKRLKAQQKMMMEANAYYRAHKTLEGCPLLTPKEIEALTAAMAQSGQTSPQPYGKNALINNYCKIRNTKLRLSELTTQTEGVMRPVFESRNSWYFYIIPDHGAKEYVAFYETAKARFLELRGKPGEGSAAQPALGLENADGSAADILHVRQGRNCLVTDFTRAERIAKDPAVSEILCRVSREIGFDLVDPPGCAPVPFEEWDNPWFPAATPGSIAAGIYDLAVQCGAVIKDGPSERKKHVGQLARLIQSGERGAGQARMLAVIYAADAGPPGAVHQSVDRLMKQFDEYQGRIQKAAVRHRKSKTR